MSELGAHFRILYVDKLKFLDEEVSNNLRSSDLSRTTISYWWRFVCMTDDAFVTYLRNRFSLSHVILNHT